MWCIGRCAAIGIILLVVWALAAACGADKPQPTPTPTKTPRPAAGSATPSAFDPANLAIVTPTPKATITKPPTNTPLPAPTSTPEPVVAEVTIDSLTLYSGPGREYSVVTQVRFNEKLLVIGRSPAEDWWLVRHGENALWVESELVRVSGPTQALVVIEPQLPTPTPPPAATFTPGPSYSPVTSAFGYGARLQFSTPDELAFVVEKVRDLQLEWVQFDIQWQDIERSAGQYDWANLDAAIEAFSSLDVRVLTTVRAAPNWARNANSDLTVAGPPANANRLATFITAFVKRYQGKVQAVELWSGQNLWHNWGREPLSATRYVDLLCRSYHAIKSVDPSIVVVSGRLEPTRFNDGLIAADDMLYLEDMYRVGAKNCLDAVGAHPAGYNNPPDARFGYTNPLEPGFKNNTSYFFRETLESYRGIVAAHGDTNRPIWPTAFGWASDPDPAAGFEYARDNTRQEQADYIVEAFRLGKSWGWVGPMFVSVLGARAAQAETDLKGFSLWLETGPTLAYERLKSIRAQ